MAWLCNGSTPFDPMTSRWPAISTTSSKSKFGNFVYQIQMTPLTGLNNENSGAGPTFRVSPDGPSRLYQVNINAKGQWEVSRASETSSSNALAEMTDACQNPCPYFHTGLNQPNVITIRAFGSKVQIQVNGYPLVSFTEFEPYWADPVHPIPAMNHL
jgi:hypothetical protein